MVKPNYYAYWPYKKYTAYKKTHKIGETISAYPQEY